MTQEAAEIICEFGGEVREGYSGRGMYGKTTTGIVFDSEGDFFEAIGEVMECDIEDREEVAKAMRNLKTDSMGTGVIYY